MIYKQCAKCGKPIAYPNIYCEACKPKAEQERQELRRDNYRRYNSTRNPKYTRFYNSKAWDTLRKRYQADHQYKCEECGALGTEVHHIVPIQTEDGWNRRLDYDNLQLLCTRCHNKKHNR